MSLAERAVPTTLATSALIFLLTLAPIRASAQDVVIQPVAPQANKDIAIARDANNLFLPRLQRALTAELHFIGKVCSPDEKQFDNIHRAGRESIRTLAIEYAEMKRTRRKVADWPHPSEQLIAALRTAVDENLPADAAAAYKDEISSRLAARRAADASAVVNAVDRRVTLHPAQQQSLYDAIHDGWQPEWSDAYVVLAYPNWAVFPEMETLNPHLTDLQQRIWAARPRRRYASLMWQLRFGVFEMFNVRGRAGFPDRNFDAMEVVP